MFYQALTNFKGLFNGKLPVIFQKGSIFRVVFLDKKIEEELKGLERAKIIEKVDRKHLVKVVELYQKV